MLSSVLYSVIYTIIFQLVTNCNGFIRLCFTFNSTMLSGY